LNDTTSIVIRDRQSNVLLKEIKGSIFFKLKKDNNYYINVNVFDFNKNTQYIQSLFANKSNIENRQNFLMKNYQDEVFYSNYFKPNEIVYITSSRNQEKLFKIDYFKSEFQLAKPPSSIEKMEQFAYKPDSSFSVYEKQSKIEIQLPTKGFFHLETNFQKHDGVTLFVYESSFPKIKDATQMILSTRYIMTKREFDNAMNASDKKTAIDNFWTEIGGSNERALALLKKYYGRVQEANKLFTSYVEGWKTDRGMVYVIFGAPNNVLKTKNSETWNYGEVGNTNYISFSFNKVSNPFTDNDFYLERNEVFKLPWYQAVDSWRQGRIYLDN
jgi:GWxTD domain-containing protein